MSQEADTARSAGDFFASALGGGLIFALFLPTGCKPPPLGKSAPLPCPAGDQTNFLGTTFSGLVGTVDAAGATVLGLIAAGICYLVAAGLRS